MKNFLIILFFLPYIFNSQNALSFEIENRIINFDISKEEYLINFDPQNLEAIEENNSIIAINKINDSTGIIKLSNLIPNLKTAEETIKNLFGTLINSVDPLLIYADGVKQICNNELLIQSQNLNTLNSHLEEYSYSITENEYMPNNYVVTFQNLSTIELFELVNYLNQQDEVVYAEPNFIRFLQPHTNDEFYSSQWSIKNEGYLGGVNDADMDVEEAWAISTGNNVLVAILDNGIDIDHPDLIANVLGGFDATGNNSSGEASPDDYHGTACAGIVAAVSNNSIGISGIAYNSKILPVRIAYNGTGGNWVTTDSWIVQGINWAVQNGADILSNSWGGGSSSSSINSAINNAVNDAVVLFSTGNGDGSVNWPATLSNVIAIGASTMCDERKTPSSCDGENWWGSNYGSQLDLVAPGVKIYTTDNFGSLGKTSTNYNPSFHGTSAACPNAAGVAALILRKKSKFIK